MKQLNMEDIGFEGVSIPEDDSENELEATPVDISLLTREQLIAECRQLKAVIENYEIKIDKEREAFRTEFDQLRNAYGEMLAGRDNLIKYYERKHKLIEDLIQLEKGE